MAAVARGAAAAVACLRVAAAAHSDACERSALLQLRRGALHLLQVVLVGTRTALIDFLRTRITGYAQRTLRAGGHFFWLRF